MLVGTETTMRSFCCGSSHDEGGLQAALGGDEDTLLGLI